MHTHLTEDEVASYIDGRLPSEERREIEAHMAECPPCSTRVAEAQALVDNLSDQTAPPLDPDVHRNAEQLGTAREKETASLGLSRSVVAAALVLVLAIGGVGYWQMRGLNSAQLRSPAETTVLTAREPADGASVSDRPVFACAPVSNALTYRVTLYAQDGSVLWEADSTATRLPLPSSVPLGSGQTYLWRMGALRSDGTTLRSSLRTFTYAP